MLYFCSSGHFCFSVKDRPEMCFFLLKCWIGWIMLDQMFEKYASFCCNVEYVEYVELFWVYGKPKGTKQRQTDSIDSTFQQKETLFRKNELVSGEIIQHGPKSSFSSNNSTWPQKWFFQQKNQHVPKMCFFAAEMLNMLNHVGSSVWKNVLLSAEMLNVLNMLNYFGSMGGQKGPNRGKIIQHIQHIRQKEALFQKRYSTWSNIFNISAERNTILKKCACFVGNNSTWPKKWFFQQQ